MKRAMFFCLLPLMLSPLLANGANWYSEYDAALKDVAARDWSSAEAKIKIAMRLQPQQGRRVFAYGVRFIRYIPTYYLGIVSFHQGRYEEALKDLQQVEKLGLVVAGDPEYEELIRLLQLAGEKLKPKKEETKPPAPPPSPIVEKPKPQPVDLQAEKQEEENRRKQQFENLMNNSREALSVKKFRQSREFANQASAVGLGDVRSSELLKRIDVAEKLDALTKAVNKKDWLQAQMIARQIASLDSGNQDLRRIQTLIDAGLSDMKIQDVEDRALLAFFSGDYPQAVLLLERVIATRNDIAEAWFYMGCSHASLGLLQGKDGNALLMKARQEFAQSRKLDPKFNYVPDLISPRVLELYEQK